MSPAQALLREVANDVVGFAYLAPELRAAITEQLDREDVPA